MADWEEKSGVLVVGEVKIVISSTILAVVTKFGKAKLMMLCSPIMIVP